LGVCGQQPITRAWYIRAAAMKGWRDELDDVAGMQFESRRKV
jgi:hypothetical protein